MTLVLGGTVSRGGFSRHVDLIVEQGRPVGLTGPNGSGKSTVLRAIAGLDRLARGSIVLDGVALDSGSTFVPTEERSVGVVFQDLRLFPHLSALDNVAFGLRCADTPRAEARSRATSVLESVGAGHLADRRPASMSGGEAQRVALARALATSPRVLLLDEPFASVDAATRPALRSLIANVTGGTTIHTVIVSHDEADLTELTDGIIRLDADR